MTPDHASTLHEEPGPEMLARVLEGLRALDTAPAPRDATDDGSGPDVVPLPRRR